MRLLNLKLSPKIVSIICLFIIWKFVLFIVSVASYELLPLYSTHLLGGGFNYYLTNFYLLPWANFDGEHFIAIAQFGYQQYTQAFFPFYPLTFTAAKIIPADPLLSLAIGGLVISSISFPAALVFLYKLLLLDYTENISLGVIFLLIIFPTSFYFNAIYSESLFLFLIVSSFYFFRTKKYFLAGLLGFFASLTRVFGVLLFFSYLLEMYQYKIPLKKVLWIFLIPLGLLTYMFYLYFSVGDFLAFYTLQLIVGEQHQKGIVLTPQVIYRYIRIFLTSPWSQTFSTTVLEFVTGILFFVLPLIGIFKKIRYSYLFFAFFGYFLTTVQGSFSSLPRYVLVLFPSFIILALMIKTLPKPIIYILAIASFILLVIETAFFVRGYWVA